MVFPTHFVLDISTPEASCTDGEIRLVDGENQLEGRVEICLNRAWGTICDTIFGEDDAHVICEQLGVAYNGKLASFDRSPSGYKQLAGVNFNSTQWTLSII